MRKIIVSAQASLDGFMSGMGPEGDPKNLDWIIPGVEESRVRVNLKRAHLFIENGPT